MLDRAEVVCFFQRAYDGEERKGKDGLVSPSSARQHLFLLRSMCSSSILLCCCWRTARTPSLANLPLSGASLLVLATSIAARRNPLRVTNSGEAPLDAALQTIRPVSDRKNNGQLVVGGKPSPATKFGACPYSKEQERVTGRLQAARKAAVEKPRNKAVFHPC